jgi:hypothetical protein
VSVDRIRALGACSGALTWLEAQEGSLYDAWRRCKRGDWLLWLAARAGVDRRLVVLAACDCAETALVHVPEGEHQPRNAIETARRWAAGEATLEEVRAASRASHAATASAAYAAYAATVYAYAADAATAASYASYAAYYATHAADAADAPVMSLAHSARLVRAGIPWRLVRDALAKV